MIQSNISKHWGHLTSSRFPAPTTSAWGLFFRLRRRSIAAASVEISRDDHNLWQSNYFADRVRALASPGAEANLQRIIGLIPHLCSASRVLDVGSGSGDIIPYLQSRGVIDILAVDICPEMLAAVDADFGPPEEHKALGNYPAVRTWCGDIVDLPSYMGPFDTAIFNAVFGNLYDPKDALLRAAFLVKPGGHIVISHPLGSRWLAQLQQSNRELVPHLLPSKEKLIEMIKDLPLNLIDFTDDVDSCYIALLQVPEGYKHPKAPIYLSGQVVQGFGRGSRQLGVPTANIDPIPLQDRLNLLESGVYFGYARLEGEECAHKMVMNIGRRPTFEDGGNPDVTVEVHILNKYEGDFYGRTLKTVALGYVRPELKFRGIGELLRRIHTDIGIAKSQLDVYWKDWTRENGDNMGFKEDA